MEPFLGGETKTAGTLDRRSQLYKKLGSLFGRKQRKKPFLVLCFLILTLLFQFPNFLRKFFKKGKYFLFINNITNHNSYFSSARYHKFDSKMLEIVGKLLAITSIRYNSILYSMLYLNPRTLVWDSDSLLRTHI